MKKTGIVFGIAAFLCMCAFLAVPAVAAADGARNGPPCGDHITGTLDKLEEQGYDVSAIRAAVESGDMETARDLLQQLMSANPDARPPQGAGRGNGERMAGMLDELASDGYDVSAIQAAIAAGDLETAHTLMQEFMAANPEAIPARGEGPGQPNGEIITKMLDKLEEQGYDVSAIRAAVESGDMETARDLLQEFMSANPDARPPQGAGTGNGERMTGMLDKLEEQGYDVSAIRAAVESGDMETARDLLQQFMSANPDARPPRGNARGGGN